MILDSKNYIFKINSKTGKEEEVPISNEERIELINRVNKLPGEQGLDERIFLSNVEGQRFEELEAYRPELVAKTKDWINHWNKEKRKFYSGILIDEEFYITGDCYFYLNYIIISYKDGRLRSPEIRDSDIWFFQLIELAELQKKFVTTCKRRQWGYSLKLLSKLLKRFLFEPKFAGKLVAPDEKYVKVGWTELETYRDHIHRNTPWKRPVVGGKLSWEQSQLLGDGTKIGLKSVLRGITTKNNATAVVSGKTDEAFFDESGTDKQLLDAIGFLKPALEDGNIIYGRLNVGGAAGNIKDCKDLQELAYNPERHNMLALPNVWSNKPDQKVCIFVPAYYSYGSCKDEFGNSKVEEAIQILEELSLVEKEKSYKDYMIFKSQNPLTLEDMFATREENDFPVDIIQPHYDFIKENYKPLEVTLYEDNGRIFHKIGSKYPEVRDFPVNKKTIKHGAVIIDEAPITNPPFGLYYAGVDTITPIKTESISVQAIYIYKAAHQINGEYHKEKFVAWYAGRTENPIETYEICLKLIQYYNARALIENNNRNFITWMIEQKQQRYMMKRSEVPIGKDLIMKTTVDTSDYGLNVKGLKEFLTGILISYVEEEVETAFKADGTPITKHGVERIGDIMLLEEMLNFSPKRNTDRHDAASLALLAARTATAHGLIVKSNHEYGNNEKKSVNYKEGLRNNFSRNTMNKRLSSSLLRNTLLR